MSAIASQYCPGGTGKKIKNCACGDIRGELEKVIRALDGKQRVAALNRVNRLLATHANRPCLLALKIECLYAMESRQELEETIATFVQAAPENPLPHALSAELEAAKGNAPEAVESLQRALCSAKESFPRELYDALLVTGEALASQGNYVAARCHLAFRAIVGTEHDEEAMKPLMEILRARNVPPLAKRELSFFMTEEGPAAEAVPFLQRGAWKAALEKLEALDQETQEQEEILHNIAVCRSFLGYENSHEAWRRLSELDSLDFAEAVFANAMAQVLEHKVETPQVDVAKLTFDVTDLDGAEQRLAASKRVVRGRASSDPDTQDEGPPPKASFQLLDREVSEQEPALDAANLPIICGTVKVFGKQTDRPPRIEVVDAAGWMIDYAREQLGTLLGDLSQTETPRQEKTGSVALERIELFPRHWIPQSISPIEQHRLKVEGMKNAIETRWCDIPQPSLDGKTSAEAAHDPAYRVPLAATALVAEQFCDLHHPLVDFNSIRRQLGLHIPPPIDPTQININDLAPHEFSRVEAEKLSDEQLAMLYARANVYFARKAIIHFGQELLRRGESEFLSADLLVDACESLGEIAELPDQALSYLQMARDYCERAGTSPAQSYIKELPIRIMFGEEDELRNALSILQAKHWNEPGVAEGVKEVFVQMRLMTPDGRPNPQLEQPAESPPEPQEPEPKIWTPYAQPAGGEKKDSKLWMPGMD